ncbi:MAG: hypothetical protein NPIRA04_20290 [Nitrospirales bacterium]|nr:MAG: hypothetical protein NPIRA04_20290 [Nitrospirales bacterium]
MTQSSELTGGAGFTFEDAVSASYLAALLGEENAPGTGDQVVTTVALQQSSFGEPLDDLIVDTEADDNSRSRLSLQVKRSLTVSAARTNKDFREIVHNSWKTLQKDDFRVGIDRYGGATGTIAEDNFRNLITICEWARASSSVAHFSSRFSQKGNASEQHKIIKNEISKLLSEIIEKEASESEIHNFFSHFVLIKFDFLHEGSTNQADLINRLRCMLTPEDNVHAPDLWARLRVIAREGSGRSAEFQRHNLLANLKGQYRFKGISSFAEDLSTLSRLASEWLRDISSDIGGIKVERTSLLNDITKSITKNRFVQIRGLPGAGKSSVLKTVVKQKLEGGPVLFLKSDRLSGNSWQEFATSIGLHIKDPENLLSEIGITGSPLLFIDGIDRIEHSQRRIVMDLIEAIMSSSALSDWHIVVTARDAGIEPLRTWLPGALFQAPGISTIDTRPFNDEESNKLAELLPALRGILFGNDRVREIARRPFFASILIEELTSSQNEGTFLPQSEIDLIERWWIRGGYDAGDTLATKRQRALIDLAKNYIRRIGRPIQQSNLMTDTVNILDDLISDGILHVVRPGHTIKFAHDIFFEWSYVHLLIDRDDQWVNEIIDAGEPPFLGRTVELLSQTKFILDEDWEENFNLISQSKLRPQWYRSWLIGPFEIPNFRDKQSLLESIVFAEKYRLLRKLLVWFQAERTAPNALVLSGELCPPDYQRNQIILIADALGWPSNINTWSRLIYWLKGNVPNFPSKVIPHVISVFEVWQNMFADINNAISKYIVNQCLAWLNDIEERQYPKEFTTDQGFWNDLDRDELQDIEKTLRTIVLRSARVFADVVQSYLEKIAPHKRIRHNVYSDIIRFSQILSESHPELLANIARQELMNELPEDRLLRKQKEQREQAETIRKIREKPEEERSQSDELMLSGPTHFISSNFSSHDWKDLSIGRTHQDYFPASPLREPFHSLFKLAPNIALNLVRDISNHAITTWRQLHNLDYERRGNPIPVKLSFPWGDQQFWGNFREYMWFRGWWGPQAIQCAYLALESWVFNELENGKSPDHIIETVVKGHHSVAALGIAVSILLHTNHITEVTLQLISCQWLWHADLHRLAAEQSNSSSSLIGFNNTPLHKTHIEAMQKSNQLAVRRSELRQLTPLFVLSSEMRIRDHAQKAIENFPSELPFIYEEEKGDKQQCDALKATAENWAEWGHQENYTTKPHPKDKSLSVIQLENPKLNEPEAISALERHEKMTHELILWNWVNKTFQTGKIPGDFKLSQAIDSAKQIDNPELFQGRNTGETSDLKLGAIAGIAAIALCIRDLSTKCERDWAREVIGRAFDTPEIQDHWSSSSIIPWHPCIFVARALAGEIKANQNSDESKQQLMRLAGHPLEQVSLEAIRCIFDCWDADSRFAWTGLDLAIKLSIGSRKHGVRSAYGYDPAYDQTNRESAISTAITSNLGKGDYAKLTSLPTAWVYAPRENLYSKRQDQEPTWQDPDIFWRWDYAPKVLKLAPIAKIMSDERLRPHFLDLCDQLLEWTLERINPSWMEDKRARRDRSKIELLEWRHDLASILAFVSSHLSAAEVYDRFLEKFFKLDDELCMSFLATFVDHFICIQILDSQDISSETIKIIDICIDRTLKDDTFRRSGYKDSEVYGFDMPNLIRSLLFIQVSDAPGSWRFANGDWKDVDKIIPFVSKFIEVAGWKPLVADSFLTLCERSSESYPSAIFADQVFSILKDEILLPTGWNGAALPARIAGLIQIFAERDYPLPIETAQQFLHILDFLVDMGDRRSAALQQSEAFKDVQIH